MAVTSMRSLGSRAIRIEIERDAGLTDNGALVPCICKTPCWEIRCRQVRGNGVPGPLVTPEGGLEARYRPEAYCDQQIATRRCRWLGEIISADKSRLSQISRDVCQSDNGAPVAREGPDINSRYVFIGARQKLKAWVLQIDAVEQKGIMPSAIKVKERYSAQQTPRPLKSKNRLRIAPQKLSEGGFR